LKWIEFVSAQPV